MKTSSLTDARLRALPAGTHTDGENLLVRVSPHGVRTFFYKFKDVQGKMQALNLGRYDTLTLSGARDLKEKCKALIAKGLHPKLALEPESETENFGQVAEMFVAHHEKTLKDGGGLRSEIERNFKLIWNKPVANIRPIDVLKCLEPMIARGAYVMAAKVSVRAKQVMQFAMNLGIIPANPLQNVKSVIPKKPVKHMRALPPAQLGVLVQGIQNADTNIIIKNLAMFILLTACRASEAALATWDEIQGDAWVIPAGRMKRKKEHRVPLSAGALAALEVMKTVRCNKYIFPGRSLEASANASSVNVMLSRAKIDTTTHGLRSIFATYCSEKSKFSTDAIEHSLAHTTGSAVRNAYTRTTFFDERIELMAWWDAEVTKAMVTE